MRPPLPSAPAAARRLPAVALAILLCAGTFGPVSTAIAAEPPVALPERPQGLTAPVRLPASVDAYAGYQPQVSCNPRPMAGVRKLRNLAMKTYGRGYAGPLSRSCAVGGASEHKEGRAWDWMLDVGDKAERKVAADFLAWLLAPGRNGAPGVQARRLGVMYVIYNRRIWSAYRADDGWRPYSGSSPHTDHIHLSFSWAGARGHTSFWTGKVARPDYGACVLFAGQPAAIAAKPRRRPCPSPAPVVARSSRPTEQVGSSNGSALRSAQAALGVAQTGVFDRRTWSTVRGYQADHDLPRTGSLDQPTWASLERSSVTWRVTKGYGPVRAARYARRNYADLTLRSGAAGKPVAFLQTALRMPAADRNGFLRARTKASVLAFKRAHGLPGTAVVDRAFWRALDGNRLG